MSSEPSYVCDACSIPYSSKGELEMHNNRQYQLTKLKKLIDKYS